jgi:hypothetical protein
MKHLYSLIVLVCLTGSGKSQINSYFNNNPCWQISSMCQIDANCFKVNYYNYFINGDSLIGSNQYKKVYFKGYGNNHYSTMGPPPVGNACASPTPTTYTLSSFAFLIRSSAKKIYIFFNKDTLLYDFNLKVGDTLPASYNNTSLNIIKVTAIDSINTFNGWMKRFQLSGNTVSSHLIEGMGHYKGLIEPIYPNVMSCGWSLQCYSQNNSAYYPSSGPSCLLSTGIKENAKLLSPIIYPNPSEGKYQVRLPEFSTNSKIEIYNSIGQLVRSFVPQSETFEIDIQKEKAGVYFLKYISNGETKSSKLIKE